MQRQTLDVMHNQIAGLALTVEWLETELAMAEGALARALTPNASTPAEPVVPMLRVRIPKLGVFGGARSSKELENFIWGHGPIHRGEPRSQERHGASSVGVPHRRRQTLVEDVRHYLGGSDQDDMGVVQVGASRVVSPGEHSGAGR